MLIRTLSSADAAAFQALRLAGLRECPEAFASSWEEEQGEPIEAVAARLKPDGVFAVYGAFDETGALVGVAGLGREHFAKMHHKATLWGLYVAPARRRRGMARALVSEVLQRAASEPVLRQVVLGVHAGNTAARALYESLGFVAWGTEPGAGFVDGQLQDETWMVCRLPGHGGRAPQPLRAVLVYCADPASARAWYHRLWPEARELRVSGPHESIDVLLHDGVQFEFVPADEKVASGKAGSVFYFRVDDFDAARARAEALGATLYRGPGEIEHGWRMAMFIDPFGNLFGLRG